MRRPSPHRRLRRPPFDAVADLYDRVRPGFPDEAVDDMIALAGLPKRGRVLEVGAGTGQLSVALAERGYGLTAVEVGPHLAERLRANLREYGNCEVVCADFHDADLGHHAYDLVVAANSFHWLDRHSAYGKAATLLRPTGAIALVFHVHVDTERGFCAEAQEVYRRHAPELVGPGTSLQVFLGIDWTAEIASTGRFGPTRTSRHPWSVSYSRKTYLELLSTHSDHLALDPAVRSSLYAELGQLIDRRYGGRVEQQYQTLVVVAPLLPSRAG